MTFALHGNIGSPGDFDFLRDIGDLNALDLWDWADLSLKETARVLANIAESHNPRGLLGYSMGGRIALQSLADFPGYWDYAVIISAHPGLTTETERDARKKSDLSWAETIRTESWETFLTQWNAQGALAGEIPQSQTSLESKKDQIASAFQNWSLGCQEDLRSALAQCETPLHWIVGENDQKFSRIGREIKALIPGLDLYSIAECGHRVLLEQPNAIKSILSKIPR